VDLHAINIGTGKWESRIWVALASVLERRRITLRFNLRVKRTPDARKQGRSGEAVNDNACLVAERDRFDDGGVQGTAGL